MAIAFLSGSIGIEIIPDEVKTVLDNIIERGDDVIVGDAPGADRVMQHYLKGYPNVVVYHVHELPRHNMGGFQTQLVPIPESMARNAHVAKDVRMSNEADYAVCLWNGRSQGTKNNAKRMREFGKPVCLWSNETGRFHKFKP